MNKRKVLVVDDTIENIDLLVGLLKDNYIVMAAKNGAIALKIAQSPNPPDIILLDILMPEMDGFEVCTKLKKNKETASIPVVFVSANIGTEERKKGDKLGAVNYLTKPINPKELFTLIETELIN